MMFDLRTPFRGHIFKGWRTDYWETDEEDVSLWVGERSEPVVILLTRGVPETQRHRDSVTNHRGRVIVETTKEQSELAGSQQLSSHLHCGDIFAWKTVCGVGYQHTSLPHRPVTHHHALDRSPARHLGWKMSTFTRYFSRFNTQSEGHSPGRPRFNPHHKKYFITSRC